MYVFIVCMYCFALYCIVSYVCMHVCLLVWHGMVWYGMVWYGMVWYVCMYECMYVCMCVCLHVRMYYMYVLYVVYVLYVLYVCMYACMHACMHVTWAHHLRLDPPTGVVCLYMVTGFPDSKVERWTGCFCFDGFAVASGWLPVGVNGSTGSPDFPVRCSVLVGSNKIATLWSSTTGTWRASCYMGGSVFKVGPTKMTFLGFPFATETNGSLAC